jgi:predicted phosphodiesterase
MKISINYGEIILTADWHLREDTPNCRKDDFYQKQFDKVKWILDFELPIIIAGDIFHRSKCSHKLIGDLVRIVKHHQEPIFVIPGNHDLYGHNNLDLAESALGTLLETGYVRLIDNPPLGQPASLFINNFAFGVLHRFMYCSKKKFRVNDEINVTDTVSFPKVWNSFDVLVSGDNHEAFHKEDSTPMIVNPGCILRQRMDQKDYVPVIFFFNLHTGKYRCRRIPIEEDVFHTDRYLPKGTEDSYEFESFVKIINDKFPSISFDSILRKVVKAGQISKGAKNLIKQAQQGEVEI